MKKTSLTLLALFVALQFSHAQWTTSSSNIYNSNAGNVGIGTTTPGAKLDVQGGTIRVGNAAGSYSGFLFNTSTGLTQENNNQVTLQGALHVNSTAGMASYIVGSGNVGIGTTTPATYLHVNGAEYAPGSSGSAQNSNLRIGAATTNLVLDAGVGTSGNPTPYSWLQSRNQSTYSANYDLALNPNGGNVGIGIINTQGYKLAVNGSAIATSMRVKPNGSWPDFVFLKDYKLPTLTEVKTYIDKNQHLPDMPSADEVHKNGLDLGEMNRLLLKKVEELTLYLMEEHDKNLTQRSKLELQEDRINSLEAALLKLIKSK